MAGKPLQNRPILVAKWLEFHVKITIFGWILAAGMCGNPERRTRTFNIFWNTPATHLPQADWQIMWDRGNENIRYISKHDTNTDGKTEKQEDREDRVWRPICLDDLSRSIQDRAMGTVYWHVHVQLKLYCNYYNCTHLYSLLITKLLQLYLNIGFA